MIDKNTVMQVLGSIMKNPLLLEEGDYLLTPYDFATSFERYIYIAINNLYQNGAERIGIIDIDSFLSTKPEIYKIFEQKKGIEYLQDIEEFAEVDNFAYYYKRLKKFNCLKDLQEQGFNTEEIYSQNSLNENQRDINERFEQIDAGDIIDIVKGNIMKVESKYGLGSSTKVDTVANGILELIEDLENNPDVGTNLQGDIFNTIVRGARPGKFYLRSAATGVGKTRSMVGDACYMAYPIRFDCATNEWIITGNTQKTLFISTEQSAEEIKTLVVAYLSGVNEETILFGNYMFGEKERVMTAIDIINRYKDNLHLAQIPDPTIQKLKSSARKFAILDKVENIFFDYIFSSPSLLSEYRDLRIREDVILGMMSAALKDISVELDVFVMSSTQVNAELESGSGIKTQMVLRGSKAMADKVDVGCITMVVSKKETEMLADLAGQYGEMPNQVTDIYKVRRGRYTSVRIWSVVDLGTCVKRDLFITTAWYEQVPGFELMKFINEDNHEVIEAYNKIILNEDESEPTPLREEKEEKEEEKGDSLKASWGDLKI